jgi:hypothetical protein
MFGRVSVRPAVTGAATDDFRTSSLRGGPSHLHYQHVENSCFRILFFVPLMALGHAPGCTWAVGPSFNSATFSNPDGTTTSESFRTTRITVYDSTGALLAGAATGYGKMVAEKEAKDAAIERNDTTYEYTYKKYPPVPGVVTWMSFERSDDYYKQQMQSRLGGWRAGPALWGIEFGAIGIFEDAHGPTDLFYAGMPLGIGVTVPVFKRLAITGRATYDILSPITDWKGYEATARADFRLLGWLLIAADARYGRYPHFGSDDGYAMTQQAITGEIVIEFQQLIQWYFNRKAGL